MAEGLEQLQVWARRIWRRRWLCLGVTWATCAVGWPGVALLTAQQTGAAVILVLLAGAAGGGLVAALVARRAPVFDSVAELQDALRRPVLGGVADLTPASWPRATPDVPFALACLALIAMLAGLLIARALG